jgi:hypothetical protein
MQDLSEPAKRMLEALKADETPSKASADRMWAAVAATGAAATVAASLGKGKLLLLGALGITGGVALWVFAGPPALEPTTSGSARSSTDARVAPANVEAQAELPPASVVETPAPALDAPAPAPVTAPEPAPVVPRSLAKKTPVKPSASATQAVDLERELALLSDAKAALGRGDAAGALAGLARHRRDFPRSSFGPERDFLRMTALCELGRRDEAREMAADFLERHPDSALRPRVEQVCRDE